MQENRSFDHYYGTYPGVRGFDDHPKNKLGNFAQAWPGGREKTLLPFHLDTASGIGECTNDLDHSWPAEHSSWNKGTNGAFVSTHVQSDYQGPEHGVLTMGYYRRKDLPFYYALADAFTLCDNYHCSVMGPTHPNRLMALSGTIDPTGAAGGPGRHHQRVIGRRLQRALGHHARGAGGRRGELEGLQPDGHPLHAGDLREVRHPQRRHPPLLQPVQEPVVDALPEGLHAAVPQRLRQRHHRRGRCPRSAGSSRPSATTSTRRRRPALGEWFTSQVLSALVANPKVWSKTVLFHMYDENDGFFDHVVPPVAPKGTPGEYLTVSPLPDDADGTAGPIGMSFRVPMLVLSPFSRGGHVASEVFDHTSQLRFLEERFGVKAPNISAWRRHTAGDLTSTLHPKRSDPTRAQAAQHVEGPDGRRAGRGLHQYVGPGGGARPGHAELPGAGAPDDADAGDGLSLGLAVTEVFLARHGETEWNRVGRRQGQLDAPLTAAGTGGRPADGGRGCARCRSMPSSRARSVAP